MNWTYTTTIIKRRPANWQIGRRMNRSRAAKQTPPFQNPFYIPVIPDAVPI